MQSDEDKANFQKLIEEIKQSDKGKTLGVFAKDNYPGAFMDGWRNALKKEDFETVDMSAAFAYLISPKEENEIVTIKKSSQISVDVFNKYLKDQIMEIIDSEKVSSISVGIILYDRNRSIEYFFVNLQKVKHRTLAEGVESAIGDKKYVSNVDTSQVDICYPAIIQSGGNYSLKFSVMR